MLEYGTGDPEEGRRDNGNLVEILKMPGTPEMKHRRYYMREFEDMMKDGYVPPGTIIEGDKKYVVCSSGRAWLEFKQAGFPLDYKLPAGEIRELPTLRQA